MKPIKPTEKEMKEIRREFEFYMDNEEWEREEVYEEIG